MFSVCMLTRLLKNYWSRNFVEHNPATNGLDFEWFLPKIKVNRGQRSNWVQNCCRESWPKLKSSLFTTLNKCAHWL